MTTTNENVHLEEQNNIDVEEQSNKGCVISHPNFNQIILKFEKVGYTSQAKEGWFMGGTKADETIILKDITGIVVPGEMLAILGPSGSGKTTFLKALGGRLSGEFIGEITYSAMPFSSLVRRNTGFVTQEDILHPQLTVYETLVFTALLGLHSSLTRQEKIGHVETVVTLLQLASVKNSIIDGASRSIRRRVSVSQIVLLKPSLMLLDEPTSGLDSNISQKIISTLWDLASGGRTIVMTIHEPSNRLFNMLQNVLVLSEGRPIYYGKASEAMSYFDSIGCSPSFDITPCEHLLDMATKDDNIILRKAYERTVEETVKVVLRDRKPINLKEEPGEEQIEQWPVSWFEQFWLLVQRNVRIKKHEISFWRISTTLTLAIVCGLLRLHRDYLEPHDESLLLFFLPMYTAFDLVGRSVLSISRKRLILDKEKLAYTYRVSAFIIAHSICQLFDLIIPSFFFTISYMMAGLTIRAENIIHGIIAFLLGNIVYQAFALFLGSIIDDVLHSTTLAGAILNTFLLDGGFYDKPVPTFVAWIKYFNVSRYTYKLLLSSQFKKDDTYDCHSSTPCMIRDVSTIKAVGLDDGQMSYLTLVIMLVTLHFVVYVFLRVKRSRTEMGSYISRLLTKMKAIFT